MVIMGRNEFEYVLGGTPLFCAFLAEQNQRYQERRIVSCVSVVYMRTRLVEVVRV